MNHGVVVVFGVFVLITCFVSSRPHNEPGSVIEEKSSNENDNDQRIRWSRFSNAFGIEFPRADAKTPIRLVRSPPMTTGEPWPRPQSFTKTKTMFTILVEDFSMQIIGHTCDVIEKAVRRCNRTVFEDSLEAYKENIRFMEHSDKIGHLFEDTRTYTGARPISTLQVMIQTECSGTPLSHTMDESYELTVGRSGITLAAKEVWGALRGLETFSQLTIVRGGQLYISETVIKDFPRFRHRGIMIDTSRHYITKSVIYDVIEGMSQNKMNVLHWHIVDDQSFPYQSKVYPELSDKGAYHYTMVYTHGDIADIIEFARLRGVRVIPEFDIPGHTLSWGFAYPDLLTNCVFSNKPGTEGFQGPLDLSNIETFEILYNLFKEVIQVFKDTHLHIGGDEVLYHCWESNTNMEKLFRILYARRKKEQEDKEKDKESNSEISRQPNATNSHDTRESRRRQNYISVEGDPVPLPVGHGLTIKNIIPITSKFYWNYLIERLTDDIRLAADVINKEVQMVMWEDAVARAKANVPRDVIIQVWSSDDAFREVISEGYRTIYSHCWYLDKISYGVDWPKFYTCDPSDIAREKDELIEGGEACVWTEYISSENLMSHLWPRTSAVAERLWSSRKPQDMIEVAKRLQEHRCRMLRRGLDVGALNGPEFCVRGRHKFKSKDRVYMELGNYWNAPMNKTILLPDIRIDDYRPSNQNIQLISIFIVVIMILNKSTRKFCWTMVKEIFSF